MRSLTALLASLLLAGGVVAPVARDVRERAYSANNRGVGLLEQFQPAEAAASFREALALDPSLTLGRLNLAIALLNVPDPEGAEREARLTVAAQPQWPQGHYVLALALRSENKTPEALESLHAVLALDPRDVGTHVNLGQIFLQARDYPQAIAHLRAAVTEEPHNGTAVYNLGLALTRSGQAEAGREQLERFQALRDSGTATLIGQSYPEQGRYAEGLVSTGAEAELVDAATPKVAFVETAALGLAAKGDARSEDSGGRGRVALLDFDGDGWLDLFEIGPQGQHLLRGAADGFAQVGADLGLSAKVGGVGVVAGDLDNDNRTDLLILREKGVTLLLYDPELGLADATSRAGLARAQGAAAASLADFDHDGDLDIFLSGGEGPDRLLQNSGDAIFKDVTVEAGLGTAFRGLASLPTDYDNGRDMDLLEIGAQGTRLLKNLRDGRFRDVAAELDLPRGAGLRCVAAADVNKDSYPDLFFGAENGDLLALSDGRGGFRVAPAPWASSGSRLAQFLDYDNDGLLDLLIFSAEGGRLLRNLGTRFVDVSAPALGDLRRAAVASVASGDVDGDGDADLVVRGTDGRTRLWRNEGGDKLGSVRVRLSGLVSNRSGIGAKLELRAGSLRQKLETSASTPATAPADVLFGLGGRGSADAVRVLWPAGILQTELGPLGVPTPGAARFATLEVKELDRKPSSCPYLYAWNGRAFDFVTDFMGGGEMGHYEGPGSWNEPDPREYVRLTDEQLRPHEGRYELRVTNELEEALFVDQLALLAIDHPRNVEVYPAEGLTVPARPERFFALSELRPPRRAQDDHGRDVLDRLARVDRRFPDDFTLGPVRGYSQDHHLVLDLGPVAERSALVLTGWTDYAFSSDNVAAQQAGLTLRAPSLEVEDAAGAWQVAIEQVGVPVGRPQSVVLDLTGIWRGPSRRVRIATNLRIYWDRIRVGTLADIPLEPRPLPAVEAGLHERGFSAEVSPDGREPFGYDYARVRQRSPWKTFPGRYTRTGDVSELLTETDDVFVTSRPGDELRLAFRADGLPQLPAGQRRTFLVLADGFSKEMDLNSATPDALGPLPFHAMSRYPYEPPESFPMTEARRQIFERYNTRVVRGAVAALDAELALGE